MYVQVMPYASGPSVRRLSKIATLLLAKNYIVMLQRTVDELRSHLVHPLHDEHSSSTITAQPRNHRALVQPSATLSQSSAIHQASVTTPNVEITSGCVLPLAAPPAELILASQMLNEPVRSHLSVGQRQRVTGYTVDFTAAACQRVCGIPRTLNSSTVSSGRCHPSRPMLPVPLLAAHLSLYKAPP